MPANLTPQYRKAEEDYRRAETAEMRVKCLETLLQLVPKHKGTDRLQGDLRARLKEARAELQAQRNSPRTGKRYRIPRQGAATVVVVGPPNSGKSRLVSTLTGADCAVAEFPFTTQEPQAGILDREDLRIQLIDTPPITRNFLQPWLIDFIRTADLVILCCDGDSDETPVATRDVLNELAARNTRLANDSGFDPESFSTVNVKTLCVLTRAASPRAVARARELATEIGSRFPVLPIEIEKPEDVDTLKAEIVAALNIIRVYTRRPGSGAANPEPITFLGDGTVEELAQKIHNELAKSVKSARIWSSGQAASRVVGKDHRLQDRDVVELQT